MLYWIFYFIVFTLSVSLFFYACSIKFFYIINIVLPILKAFLFLLKILKFRNIFNLFLRFFSFRKKIKINKLNNFDNENISLNIKREPTISKNNSLNNSFKNIADKKSYVKSDFNTYRIPPTNLLLTSLEKDYASKEIEKRNKTNIEKLENILQDFGVTGKIKSFKTGPIITLFEFQPSAGIKSSKIISLADDLARSMSSTSTRISSLPGKNAIGIEIPNEKKRQVYLGDLVK